MKIALLNIHFHKRGGSERRTYELARGLIQEGCEVHIYSHTFDDSLGQSGLTWHRVPLLKVDSAAKVLSFAYFCQKMLQKERYDIVHSQARTLSQDLITVGYTCHKEYLNMLRRTGMSKGGYVAKRMQPVHFAILLLEKRQYDRKQCSKIIAISRLTKLGLLRHYAYPSKDISIVYNGVDAETFSPDRCLIMRKAVREKLGIERDDSVLLLVGHEFHRKGVADLIYALAQIPAEKRRGIKALIVGRGDLKSYRRIAQAKQVSETIRFLGNQRKILPFYAASDIFVLPSRLDAFSNAVLEAMSCGLPVIVSQETGASEIVSPGREGYVLKKKRRDSELAQCILLLLEKDARVAMGKHARAKAESLPWERTVRETLQVYKGIIRERG